MQNKLGSPEAAENLRATGPEADIILDTRDAAAEQVHPIVQKIRRGGESTNRLISIVHAVPAELANVVSHIAGTVSGGFRRNRETFNKSDAAAAGELPPRRRGDGTVDNVSLSA